MKVRIKSNGSVDGTTITDVETGEPVDNVRAMTISADADTGEFRVFLELHAFDRFEIDVEADAEIDAKKPE